MVLIAIASVPLTAQPRTLGVLFWHESPNDQAALEGFREGLDATGCR